MNNYELAEARFDMSIPGLARPLTIKGWQVREDNLDIGFTGLDRFAICNLILGEKYVTKDGITIKRVN